MNNLPEDFDWNIYIKLNNDLSNIKLKSHAIKHYLKHGKSENRLYKIDKTNYPIDFNWKNYIILNPDLKCINKSDALIHYLQFGKKEKRKYTDYGLERVCITEKHLDDVINYPLVINSLLFKNLSFKYKIQFTVQNKKIPNIFNSSSSTIIKYPSFKDRYILNIRCVNYKLNLLGHSSIVSDNDICFTSNCIIVLKSNFDIIYKNIYHPQICHTPFIGIEDIRLFNFNKKIYYIGSSYDKITNKVKISSAEYNMHENYKLNFITPTFDTDYNWEKNWVFFENNNEMFVIYKWSPIYICKIDYNTNTLNLIKKIDVPVKFHNFRGSTNGIVFDNKIWFVVHLQININNKKHYYHRFVVLNKNLTIHGYSKMFKFENYLVEFCIGLELSFRNNFIITYSTLDSKTKLTVFSSQQISRLIIYK